MKEKESPPQSRGLNGFILLQKEKGGEITAKAFQLTKGAFGEIFTKVDDQFWKVFANTMDTTGNNRLKKIAEGTVHTMCNGILKIGEAADLIKRGQFKQVGEKIFDASFKPAVLTTNMVIFFSFLKSCFNSKNDIDFSEAVVIQAAASIVSNTLLLALYTESPLSKFERDKQ